ncbi:MAG: hypothetical protein NT027_17275 [Proteobacteria bacterium]|nr:hypothetical protein [Pseudomonadota bacterium]
MLIFIMAFVCILSISAAVYFFKGQRHLKVILNEGARAYEGLQSRSDAAQKRIQKLDSELAQAKFDSSEARDSLHELRQSVADYQANSELNLTRLEKKIRDVEAQRDLIEKTHHGFLNSAESNQLQVEDLKRRNDELSTNLALVTSELNQTKVELNTIKSSNVKAESSKIRTLEKELHLFKSYLGPNPRDFDTLRRKVGQYETMYQGMKSLREMADERTKNWELALKELSTWILKSSQLAKPNDPILSESIGPIVGEALQRIGVTLVHDELEIETQSDSLAKSSTSTDSADSTH